MSNDTSSDFFGDPIYAYTRSDALRDGVPGCDACHLV